MRRVHLPLWLDSASKPRAGTFIVLFILEAWCRAILLTLVPLEAHRLLHDAQGVSILYFAVAVVGLAATLGIPLIVHVIRRRWAFTLGGALMMIAVGGYASGSPLLFGLGLACQFAATAIFEIVLNLFVLDHVPRKEINKFEPRRLLYVAAPFTFGPWLGVWLASNVGNWATYALVAGCAAVMLMFFWFLRITDNPAVTQPLRPTPNPIRYLPHFFVQPRLRLAWVLAIGRTSWWILFFVYGPIYLTGIGYSPEMSAFIVSLGVAPMFLAPFWGAVARKRGVRFVLVLGYALTGVVTMLIGAADGYPVLGAVLVVASATAAIIIDGVGNVHFLRAVHPYERAEMTSVYVTFRQTAQLLTPGIFAGILGVFALPAVFVAGGISCLGMACLARFLPKKL